jgi:hypothetical protein
MSDDSEQAASILVKDLTTKSAKIRRLAEAGYARADIARFLGIRYQHVRKVLIDGKGETVNKAAEVKPAGNKNAKLDEPRQPLLPETRIKSGFVSVGCDLSP